MKTRSPGRQLTAGADAGSIERIRLSSSKSRDKRRDKYSSAAEATFMFHKGQKVPFGVPEMLRHCDAQWYAYLERLINNPDEPNPLEQYQDAVLR